MVRASVLALTLTGCTLLAPEHELRVTEYGGGGWYMAATGEAAGCRVVRSGEVAGCLTYAGDKCTYESVGCK